MAITIIKKPAQFFNCTNAAIFEFTTDSVVGNFDDYICDIFIKSEYGSKSAVIRNVFPNTQTKIFSVDVSEFLKALQLNGFEFEFNGTKNLSIEKFSLDLRIRDGSIPSAEIFSFDDYYFDNLVFTDGLDSIDGMVEIFYSILGERLMFDKYANPLVDNKLTFLTPEVIEVCDQFDNYISIFNNELTGNTISVLGIASAITPIDGVASYKLTAGQLDKINSLIEITSTNQNPSKKLFAYPYGADCEPIVQFRFFNGKGGFSYFYSTVKSEESNRTKVEFYNRNYFNENENRPMAVQSDSEYDSSIDFKGSKTIRLKELFDMMLRSPKIEMNLKNINGNDLFIECEITGKCADVFTYFDYSLKAKIKNSNNFKL